MQTKKEQFFHLSRGISSIDERVGDYQTSREERHGAIQSINQKTKFADRNTCRSKQRYQKPRPETQAQTSKKSACSDICTS